MTRSAMFWYLQRITGGLLVVLLAAHFWVEHFASAPLRSGQLTYDIVVARLRNPVWQAIDIAFLLVALFHGLSGLRNIVLDYGRIGPMARRAITVVLIVAGVVWAYWGIDAFRRL